MWTFLKGSAKNIDEDGDSSVEDESVTLDEEEGSLPDISLDADRSFAVTGSLKTKKKPGVSRTTRLATPRANQVKKPAPPKLHKNNVNESRSRSLQSSPLKARKAQPRMIAGGRGSARARSKPSMTVPTSGTSMTSLDARKSRARQAEEKHLRRTKTAATTRAKQKKNAGEPPLPLPQHRRRSSVNRAIRIARSVTSTRHETFDDEVEGEEAMAMAEAIMGAISTPRAAGVNGVDTDDIDEAGDIEDDRMVENIIRVDEVAPAPPRASSSEMSPLMNRRAMMSMWKKRIGDFAASTSISAGPTISGSSHDSSFTVSQNSAEFDLEEKLVASSMPSFAHIISVPSTGKVGKADIKFNFKDKAATSRGHGQTSHNGTNPRASSLPRPKMSFQVNKSRFASDDSFNPQKEKKRTRPTPQGLQIITSRALNHASDGNAEGRNRAWSLIDDAMEALSPGPRSRGTNLSPKAQSRATSPIFAGFTVELSDAIDHSSPAGASSGSETEAASDTARSSSGEPLLEPSLNPNVDQVILESFLYMKGDSSEAFTGKGWKKRYFMLVKGGRYGYGPRGRGSLLWMKKEPTAEARSIVVSTGNECALLLKKEGGREIPLSDVDFGLRYDKAPAKTFGFLITHGLGTYEMPLASDTRDQRQIWLTTLRQLLRGSLLAPVWSAGAATAQATTPSHNSRLLKGSSQQQIIYSTQSIRDNRRNDNSQSLPRTLDKASVHSPAQRSTSSPLVEARTKEPASIPESKGPQVPSRKLATTEKWMPRPVLKVDAMEVSSHGVANTAQTSRDPTDTKETAAVSMSERPRSAPHERPIRASTTGSGSSFDMGMGSLEWRERLRRAMPARIEQLHWKQLIAVCTPDDLMILNKGIKMIVSNTGGAVFYAFFRGKRIRNKERRISPRSENSSIGQGLEGIVESLGSASSVGHGIGSRSRELQTSSDFTGPTRTTLRQKNNPSERFCLDEDELDEANYGSETTGATSNITESTTDDAGGEDQDELSNDEDEQDEDDGNNEYPDGSPVVRGPEQVCILKFCRMMMDTQSEFCANQVAMALHIQVPACRMLRKKDDEWDFVAEASYKLRRDAQLVPEMLDVVKHCDHLEDRLLHTACGLVFEFVHSGSSLHLEGLLPALELEAAERAEWKRASTEPEAAAVLASALSDGRFIGDSQLPWRGPGRSTSNPGSSNSGTGDDSSSVNSFVTSPITLSASSSSTATLSFSSPQLEMAFSGGEMRRRSHLTLAKVGKSQAVRPSLVDAATPPDVDMKPVDVSDNAGRLEDEAASLALPQDDLADVSEKDIGEIIGETLIFDIAIRNPDRFPCAALGWRGNLDNVMWVERSRYSGTRTLWIIDSAIPRRPLRLQNSDDKVAIPMVLRRALQGVAYHEDKTIALEDSNGDPNAPEAMRATAELLYELVGGGTSSSVKRSAEIAHFECHVPAFRRGIQRCLRRCRGLLTNTLEPLHGTLQLHFDEIAEELEKLHQDQDLAHAVPQKNRKPYTGALANAVVSATGSDKQLKKTGKGGSGDSCAVDNSKPRKNAFRRRFDTNDVRHANQYRQRLAGSKKQSAAAGEAKEVAEKERASAVAAEEGDGESGDAEVDSPALIGPHSTPAPPDSTVVGSDPDPQVESGSSRMSPIVRKMGRKWAKLSTTRDRSGSQAMEEAELPPDKGGSTVGEGAMKSPDQPHAGPSITARGGDHNRDVSERRTNQLEGSPGAISLTSPGSGKVGRDATLALINHWTRMFWSCGKELERSFEEYLMAQERYEEELQEAQEMIEATRMMELTRADAAEQAAANALAATELVRKEPPQTAIVTGFVDTGSTNCFVGAYELKIRLEHVTKRLRLLHDTEEEMAQTLDQGYGTDDEEDLLVMTTME